METTYLGVEFSFVTVSPVQAEELVPQYVVATRSVGREANRELVDISTVDLRDVLVDLRRSPDLVVGLSARDKAFLVELDELEGLLVDLVAGATTARRQVVQLGARVLEPADLVEAAHLDLVARLDGDVGLGALRVRVADDVCVAELGHGHRSLVARGEAPRHELACVGVLSPGFVPRVGLSVDDDLPDVAVCEDHRR